MLKRKDGNILMGRSSDISAQIPLLEEHGGVAQIYIHDRHMAKAGMAKNTEALGLGIICSAIIWDRVFKPFLDKTTGEAGTGPTEPTMWGKFLMPIKEPEDTAIAPDSTR